MRSSDLVPKKVLASAGCIVLTIVGMLLWTPY